MPSGMQASPPSSPTTRAGFASSAGCGGFGNNISDSLHFGWVAAITPLRSVMTATRRNQPSEWLQAVSSHPPPAEATIAASRRVQGVRSSNLRVPTIFTSNAAGAAFSFRWSGRFDSTQARLRVAVGLPPALSGPSGLRSPRPQPPNAAGLTCQISASRPFLLHIVPSVRPSTALTLFRAREHSVPPAWKLASTRAQPRTRARFAGGAGRTGEKRTPDCVFWGGCGHRCATTATHPDQRVGLSRPSPSPARLSLA
jgi:hypothetical protein